MKHKVKKLLLMLVVIVLTTIGATLINTNVQAGTVELFNDDYATKGNWFGIPVNVFQSEGLSLWCIDHKTPLGDAITAPMALQEALYYNERSSAFSGIAYTLDGYGRTVVSDDYKGGKFYKYYSRTDAGGNYAGELLEGHSDARYNWNEQYRPYGYQLSEYKGADMVINTIRNRNIGLPLGSDLAGNSRKYLYSIKYSPDAYGIVGENDTVLIDGNYVYLKQPALYVLSAMPVYTNGVEKSGIYESLSTEQKQRRFLYCL